MLALEGIKVLDLSRGGPGPFCTWVLGDLGAEVISIGEPLSRRSPMARRRPVAQTLNRNKKSVILNLKHDESRQIFYRLAEKSDVVVEGFRPGVAKNLGVDHETVARINPRIVYCAITGYGQDGPYRDLPGHDINYISLAGALGLIGKKDGEPIVPLNLLADYGGGGMSAAIGILSAIIARSTTGKGQFIDVSMMDSVISLLASMIGRYFQYGVLPNRGEIALGGTYPYYSVYRTRDGNFISIACSEPWFWENFCREIGKEEFIPFQRKEEHSLKPPEGKEWEDVRAYLTDYFLTRTSDEWFAMFREKNIPIARVSSLDEVLADPQVLHRNMIVEVEHPTEGKIKQVGIAIKLSDTPGSVRSLPPAPGEHTEEILLGLGYSKQKIDEFRRAGYIQ